jgi:hypothetical protein
MANSKIYLEVQGHTIPFPGAHVNRRLNKDLTLINLPYFENTKTGGTIGRDLLRVEDTFTVDGIWEDDNEISPRYDGWPTFGRYQLVCALAKQKRIVCSFVWHHLTYSCVLKKFVFIKHSGQSNDGSYSLTLIVVTDDPTQKEEKLWL